MQERRPSSWERPPDDYDDDGGDDNAGDDFDDDDDVDDYDDGDGDDEGDDDDGDGDDEPIQAARHLPQGCLQQGLREAPLLHVQG